MPDLTERLPPVADYYYQCALRGIDPNTGKRFPPCRTTHAAVGVEHDLREGKEIVVAGRDKPRNLTLKAREVFANFSDFPPFKMDD